MNERIGGDRSSLSSTTIVRKNQPAGSTEDKGTDAQHPHHFAHARSTRPGVEPETQPDCCRDLSAPDIIRPGYRRGRWDTCKITPTHYFATLMTALDEGNPSDRQDCMFL